MALLVLFGGCINKKLRKRPPAPAPTKARPQAGLSAAQLGILAGLTSNDALVRLRTEMKFKAMGEGGVPVAAQLLRSPDVKVRKRGVALLGELGGPKAAVALANALGTQEAEIAPEAMLALAGIGADALPPLVGVVKTAGEEALPDLATTFLLIGDRRAVDLLVASLSGTTRSGGGAANAAVASARHNIAKVLCAVTPAAYHIDRNSGDADQRKAIQDWQSWWATEGATFEFERVPLSSVLKPTPKPVPKAPAKAAAPKSSEAKGKAAPAKAKAAPAPSTKPKSSKAKAKAAPAKTPAKAKAAPAPSTKPKSSKAKAKAKATPAKTPAKAKAKAAPAKTPAKAKAAAK